MLRHQRLQNIPQIFSIIGKCIDEQEQAELKEAYDGDSARSLQKQSYTEYKNLLFFLSGISPSKKLFSCMSLLYMKKACGALNTAGLSPNA